MVEDAIERIRAHLREPGKSKTGLALEAGLSPNALRDVDQDGWNPSANTLRAIERVLLSDQPADLARVA